MYFKHPKTGQGFPYKIIKKPRVKNLNLKILKNREVQIIIPQSRLYNISQRKVEKILKDKFNFIISALKRYEKLAQKYPDLFDFTESHYRQHRKQSQELIKSKVDYYCRQHNFQYNRISIRNQSTRWGSCSSKGNLNFSYKIIFLLPEEQDYIIVHELCHLREQNHSRDFWNLVEEILPEYKNIHKSIKDKS